MLPNDAPNYLQAADIHNVAGGTPSFFDSPTDYISDKVSSAGESLSNAPNFAISSIASGVNSIYNSGVAAGNFFGVTDAEQNDVGKTLAGWDTDLGNYYNANKQSADVVGFMVTSLLPGIGGIKIFNAGQKVLSGALEAGTVGRTLAEATGLIPTVVNVGGKAATLTDVAAAGIAQSQQTFSFLNAGVLKAIAGGVAQNVWEGAAFESMIQATMFKSPLLDGQDARSIATDIMMGGAVQGVFGGLIHTAQVRGKVVSEIADQAAKDYPFKAQTSKAGLDQYPADRIIAGNYDMVTTPASGDARQAGMVAQKLQSTQNDIRSAFHQLAGGDKDLGNIVADNMQGLDPDTVSQAVAGATKISRPGMVLSPGEGETIGHIRLYGENAGRVTFDPLHDGDLTLADKIPGGKAEIDSTVAKFASKYSPDGKVKSVWGTPGDLWTPATATSMDEVEARYIWAKTTAKYSEGMTIGAHDIPLLEGALQRGLNIKVDGMDGFGPYEVNAANLSNEVLKNKQSLVDELGKAKESLWGFRASGDAATDLKSGVQTVSSSQIARAANVSVKAIENTVADDSASGVSMFARQDAQAAYDKMRADKKLSGGESNLDYIPQHAQVSYKTTGMAGANGDTVSAYADVKTRQVVAQQAIDNVFAGIAGKETDSFPAAGKGVIPKANPNGAGPGVLSYANGQYGSTASFFEQIGAATNRVMQKLSKDVKDITESSFLKLRTDQESAIAFDKLNNTIASTSEKYILREDGKGLISQKLARYNADVQAGKKGLTVPTLEGGAPDFIPFHNDAVANGWMAHMEANGYIVNHENNLVSSSMGVQSGKDAGVAYPVRPSPKSMPYYAFVKDESIVGEGMGHTSMIHAATEKDLADMIAMARAKTGYTVYTGEDTKAFFKAQQEFEWDRTLHDNYMDANLRSAGINNQFFPKTDPNKIMDMFDQWHQTKASALAREATATKYANEFDQLDSLGAQYTNIAASKYKSSFETIQNTVKNPYTDYKKAALNISRLGEYPFLDTMNKTFSNTINGTLQRIFDAFEVARSGKDLQLVNDALEKAGVNSAYKSAAEVLLANHSAPPQYVGNFIRGANAILQNLHLRLDFLNPIHITAASQVLLGHEIPGALRAVLRDSEDLGVTVPGTTDKILSPLKLIGNAQSGWINRMSEGKEAFFKANGWGKDVRQGYQDITRDLTIGGTETPSQFENILAGARDKAQQLVQVGGKITGNDYVHHYNQFVSAHIADQIVDHGIANGMLDEGDRLPFINTFVNRTNANTLASQRPLLFQGPIGQALGLFQSYQFNVMQQMFRSIGEGSTKDAAMLLGLQGTMFGLSGMPGFNYINQHIIGTNSNNPEHKDAYSALYGSFGKTAGDWLMYGVPSNLLQTNIYSRGNINPRSLTIIPTAPQDVFAVADFAKFAGNLKDTVSKLAGGGDVWQTVLQGIEHNGLSRPLSGLAQTAQALGGSGKVFSTTGQGDVSFVNDFMSLATLSRLAGGKPLDEAHVNDEMQLHKVYQAADHQRMLQATDTFKTHVVGTQNPNLDSATVIGATHDYMKAFVDNGGRAQDFNKQMLNVITRANTPRANQVMNAMKGPYAERMKSFMGGSVDDFADQSQ